MKWIPIDPNNLPEGEVLAGCFDKDNHYYGRKVIGELSECLFDKNRIECRSRKDHLFDPTHYIDINKHDPE